MDYYTVYKLGEIVILMNDVVNVNACLIGDTRKRHCPSGKFRQLSWGRVLEAVNVVSPGGRTLEEVKRKKECYASIVKKKVRILSLGKIGFMKYIFSHKMCF